MNKTRPLPAFQDARGAITDLLQNEEIQAITLISFTRGAVRGNHYHKHTTQWNYVLAGRIRLATQLPDGDLVETILQKGELAVTVPNERHALQAIENSELMVFTKGPRGGKEYESDTYRLEVPLISSA
jgi:quercetin dioxygenase-like cupin family protein